MIYRLVLFGRWEVVAIETIETEEDEPMISGGVTHNFERDLEPFNPADKGEWDEDRFGFR